MFFNFFSSLLSGPYNLLKRMTPLLNHPVVFQFILVDICCRGKQQSLDSIYTKVKNLFYMIIWALKLHV